MLPPPPPPRRRRLNDRSPAWIHWRRTCLEDNSDALVFNAASVLHRCWAPGGKIEIIDSRNGLYGCRSCGRLHECLADADSCPVQQNPHDLSYVCAFSGRSVAESDAVVGTWDLEQLAHSAAHLSSSSSAWVHTTSSKYHRERANFISDPAERKRELKKADEAARLRRAVQEIDTMSSLLEVEEEKTKKKKKKKKKEEEEEENNDEGTREQKHRGENDSEDEGNNAFVVVGGLAERARGIFYDPEELERDSEYHARLFAPLAARLAHLAPHFQRLREERLCAAVPPRPSLASSPSPPRALRSSEQDVRDSLNRIQRLVTELVSLLEVLTARVSQASVATQARVKYYTPVVRRLIELAEDRPLLAIQAADLARLVAVVFLDVLATSLLAEDSSGNRLFAWVADPWLRWCKKEGRLVQTLIQYDAWSKATKKPYHNRITAPTRKRKRRDSDGRELVVSAAQVPGGPCPVSPEAHRALEALSKTTMNALLLAAGNISHQGNAMREALRQRIQSPIGLYAAVHSSLLTSTL